MSQDYGIKRNKGRMVDRDNRMIGKRGDDDIRINRSRSNRMIDVDRIMLERQMTTHGFDDSDNVGEITGERMTDTDIYDKGMPMRSSYQVRKSKYDENSHLDFDLHRKIDRKERNERVQYNDSYAGEYAGLDEAMRTITKGVDPLECCISDQNNITIWMHNNMWMISKDDYVVNGYSLFIGFAGLYIASRDNLELEMKNYFGFQEKRNLGAGIGAIMEDINTFRNQININNYLINDRFIPSNQTNVRHFKNFFTNLTVNKHCPDAEERRLNAILNKTSGMSDLISRNTLLNTEVSLITTCRIDPIWGYRIDQIIKSRFKGEMVKFIQFIGKTFDYFEDADMQLVEIPLYGDELVCGMILPKNVQDQGTDLEKINQALNYIKPTVLDEVMFPMITKRYKTRMVGILQKTGLNVIFLENGLEGLFPEGAHLNDCVQYVDINFTGKCTKRDSKNSGYRTVRKFTATREFEYYLRHRESNIIMVMGRY
jgi:serine protease inhibitor